jgi:hypothetical protein
MDNSYLPKIFFDSIKNQGRKRKIKAALKSDFDKRQQDGKALSENDMKKFLEMLQKKNKKFMTGR